MLKLIIDRQEVVTPADFSAEYHITNPYFTREGEHTYDIDIDITNPVNAKVYGHINRHDVASWPKNRSALIVTEQGTVMRGTEVIRQDTISRRNIGTELPERKEHDAAGPWHCCTPSECQRGIGFSVRQLSWLGICLYSFLCRQRDGTQGL